MFIIIVSYLYYDYNRREFNDIKRKINLYSHMYSMIPDNFISLYDLLPVIVINSYQVLCYAIIINIYIYTKICVIDNLSVHSICYICTSCMFSVTAYIYLLNVKCREILV